MANIEINQSYGYDVITEKKGNLVTDINKMLENGAISKEGAEYLLGQFKNVVQICGNYKNTSIEDKINAVNSGPVRF